MISLNPMTSETYAQWLEVSIREYADEKIKAGNYNAEEGLERAREEFARYLPEGLRTTDHHLFSIYSSEEQANVGNLWVAIQRPTTGIQAFIFDVKIDEAFRRRGYARAAFLALEDFLKPLGVKKIGLHVFGHNTGARILYEGLGYQATNINMVKHIDA